MRQRKDGSEQVKIVYPKFKNGEGTVRDVKKEPVFGKNIYIKNG